MTVSMIWAQSRDGSIGAGTHMLWHVPADFAHFKESTLGCPVIMGRRSWDALGGPLPHRRNIVITSQKDFVADGGEVVFSLEEAIEVAGTCHRIWIAGGGQIYAQGMEIAEELVVSYLDLDASGAVKAPVIDPDLWEIDRERSDSTWREVSGDARWKVIIWVRK